MLLEHPASSFSLPNHFLSKTLEPSHSPRNSVNKTPLSIQWLMIHHSTIGRRGLQYRYGEVYHFLQHNHSLHLRASITSSRRQSPDTPLSLLMQPLIIDMELFSANVIISKPDEAETLGGLYTIHGYLSLQMKRKMEMKDRRTSGTGNKESPCNSARTSNTCRFDSSLVRVTKKFLELFDKAPDSSLDLNKAAEILEVPKRRLYDITGVLEGIGLIEKKHKNAICWKIQEEPNSELNASVARLKSSIEDFISKEHELDEQISEMQARIKKFIEDEKTQKLLFLTESDLKGLPGFKNQTLIAVRAPQGTTLEVPDPDQRGDGTQRRYRFIVRSNAGPIQVHLVSKFEEDFGGAAENSMACLGSNGQSEIIPSDDANPDDTVYWLSSDPGFSISDLWDLSPEVKWDHFLASEVPTVRPGRDKLCSTDLDAPTRF